jgi:hypothetical protein
MEEEVVNMTKRERFDRIALAVLAAVCICAIWAICTAKPADADPGTIEVRGYIPLAPDPALEIGGGLAIQVAEIDPVWPFLGPLFPGHGVFADILYLGGQGHLGVSGSVKPMSRDNGLRVFGSAWWEGDARWTCGLSQVVSTW